MMQQRKDASKSQHGLLGGKKFNSLSLSGSWVLCSAARRRHDSNHSKKGYLQDKCQHTGQTRLSLVSHLLDIAANGLCTHRRLLHVALQRLDVLIVLLQRTADGFLHTSYARTPNPKSNSTHVYPQAHAHTQTSTCMYTQTSTGMYTQTSTGKIEDPHKVKVYMDI